MVLSVANASEMAQINYAFFKDGYSTKGARRFFPKIVYRTHPELSDINFMPVQQFVPIFLRNPNFMHFPHEKHLCFYSRPERLRDSIDWSLSYKSKAVPNELPLDEYPKLLHHLKFFGCVRVLVWV